MKIKMIMAITSALALSACDHDDKVVASAETANFLGSVDISGSPLVGETLSADITDNNGVESANATYTWMADGTAISGASTSTYMLSATDVGTMISVTVNYIDNGDFTETAISSKTAAIEFVPVQSAGTVEITGDAYVGLDLTAVITDDNGSGATTITYAWMAAGVAIAGADTSRYTLTDDELGKTITVVVNYVDNDGFDEIDNESAPTAAVTEQPSDVVTTKVAEITDTEGVGIGDGTKDTGELRFKLSDASIDPLETGKLTVSFKKTGDASNNNPNDNETNNKDAYLGLYGSSTNSGFDLVELRIQDGGYVLRNQDGITISNTFTDDDWVDVEVTWDASSATATSGPLITFSIDGTDVTTAAFPTLDSGKTDALLSLVDGLQHLVFKLGDNDATVAASFYIDNIKLYSDTAGTTLVFEDDFESYTTGYSLDVDDNTDSPYNSNTNEAVVAEVEAPTVPEVPEVPGVINLQAVALTDTKGVGIGDGTKDTGELRLKLSDESIDPLATGMLSLSFRKAGDASNNNPNDNETNVKDAYIGLYGSSTSSGFDLVELRIQDGGYVLRNQDGIAISNTFTSDDWVDVVMTWDATSATTTSGPLITVSIDGTDVTAAAFPTLDSGKTDALASLMAGVQHLVLKIGDNDATVAASFYIDNIKLYSDIDGSTLVFEDDFEAPTYTVGDILDTNNSPYNSSTNEATIADR